MPNAKNRDLAKDARIIAERMRYESSALGRFSTGGPKRFIPFARWYDEVADALETTLD